MASEIQQVQTPYELLIRWGDNGALQGGQIQFLTRILDGTGNLLSSGVSDPQSVAVAGQNGLVLTDLMSEALVAALTQIDALNSQNTTLTQQIDSLNNQNGALAQQLADLQRAQA